MDSRRRNWDQERVTRATGPDGSIIKVLSAVTASHTDASMLTSVACVRTLFLAVFCGADEQIPWFYLGKKL
jgi:hypothetical protein